MNFLITGGTGFIGTYLTKFLLGQGHNITILSRNKNKIRQNIRAIKYIPEIGDDEYFDVIINLAGANISNRWTESYKRELVASRVDTTKNIMSLIARLKKKPELLISVSAVGYYGAQDKNPLDEQSGYVDDFTHSLCSQWEEEAIKAENYGVRTCIARLGVVLGKNGGALQKMLPAFKLGLGGKIGTGEQFFSWVHIKDVISAFDTFIKNKKYKGIYNLTAPNPVTNAHFAKALGNALNRPAILPMPEFAIKLLFGEMGENLLLKGQNVIPRKLEESGFKFTYPNIEPALNDIFSE